MPGPGFPQKVAPSSKGCWAVQDKRVYLSKLGSVHGVDNMKKELQNGPISCGIGATDKLESYTGGIFQQSGLHMINHEISLVG